MYYSRHQYYIKETVCAVILVTEIVILSCCTGMKLEWATVKDSKLYVGTHGIEMLSSNGGTVIDRTLMWVSKIDKNGVIEHLNWQQNFVKLWEAVGVKLPGYVIHEACVWSDVHRRWFFLPRKLSKDKYDEHTDSTQKGSNVLLSAKSDFEDIKVRY